ncbi:hypothetical protein [Rhodopila sp.]|jgi:hypothetical protein|uniref:hypothetical protein n=1 Tax=Rhodopila sp. TaxID=2480087 RepID=UPI002C930E35|nr:hypothetical protein [Rhodopila sp.]HVZ08874.1 hypothetical protein [Rhodopila sp.]
MPILIDELLVEAEPPRAPAETNVAAQGARPAQPGQGDRMLELAIVADRHYRLEVD